jgi:hypothetical protein
MAWILYIVGGLTALVVIMAIIGLMLPASHVAARRAKLAKPASEVWQALVDIDAQPRWRKGLRNIEHLDARDGKRCFRELTSQGVITYVLDEDRAPTTKQPGLRIARIADDRLPFGGRWIYELATDGTLTITEDGFVKNPVFRFLSKTVFSQSATLEQFLRSLAMHIGSDASPEPAEPSQLAKR